MPPLFIASFLLLYELANCQTVRLSNELIPAKVEALQEAGFVNFYARCLRSLHQGRCCAFYGIPKCRRKYPKRNPWAVRRRNILKYVLSVDEDVLF